jgi:putative ATP-dependent endonuclease of the OLD family
LDSQASNEGNNLNILETIGSEEFRLTHQPNFEGDIFEQTWDKDKPWKATNLINNDFQTYQEKLLRFFKFVVGYENFDALELTPVAETV